MGRYLVIEHLGAGGLGDVYSCYDPKLDRCVAVKVLREAGLQTAESHGADGRERAVREAKALARLAHPNVVSVHDVGTFEGEVFIAMELVRGLTLGRWCRAEPRGWREIRDVFVEAGAGLAAAHDAGIIHRDFKPANVMVDAQGRAQVLDFGLARAAKLEGGLSEAAVEIPGEPSRVTDPLAESITMEGIVIGTPLFMSPEQLSAPERVGPESDQFSFCVALWTALHRQHPFDGDAVEQVVASIVRYQWRAVPRRDGVPAWLDRALRRGLSYDPAERFASMHELLFAMRADTRAAKRRTVWVAFSAILASVSVAAASVALRPAPTAEHRDQVGTIADEARDAAARSNFIYPAVDASDEPTSLTKVLELEALEGPIAADAFAKAQELRAEFSATLTRLGDRYYERPGGRPFAGDYYAAALVFASDNERARTRTALTPGEIAWLRERASRGEFTEREIVAAAPLAALAETDAHRRRERLAALYAREDSPSSSTTTLLTKLLGQDEMSVVRRDAEVAGTRERMPTVREVLPEVTSPPPVAPAMAADDAQPEEMPTSDARAGARLVAQADEAFENGRFDASESLYYKAIAADRGNARALAGLASLYFERGRYARAVKFGQRAVKAAPRVSKHRILLGDAYFKTLEFSKARRQYERAEALGNTTSAARLKQLAARAGEP